MHSLGNDIIVLPQESHIPEEDIKTLAHRRYGIGCDQVMGLGSQMCIWNQDGTKALACGNGTRCVIAYLNPPYDQKIRLNGPVGPLTGWQTADGLVHVQQGHPLVGGVVHNGITTPLPAIDLSSYGYEYGIPANIGNPHLVIKGTPPASSSPLWHALSQHPAFPDGVNVSFVYADPEFADPELADPELRVMTWERGAGLTLGCGSGACAVAAVLWHTPSFSSYFSLNPSCNALSLLMPGGRIFINFTDQGLVHAASTSTICWGWWRKSLPSSWDEHRGSSQILAHPASQIMD